MSRSKRFSRSIKGLLIVVLTIWLAGCSPLLTGDMKFQMGDYPGAITDLTTYLETHPDSFQGHYMLGRTYLEAGDAAKAASTLEQALALKPGDAEAIIYLGLAYVAQDNYEMAITTLAQFKDNDRPIVAAAVKKQLTLLKIAQSKKQAKAALASEKSLAGTRPAGNTYAVCYYADKSPEKDMQAFSKALAAMTISNLSKIDSIQIVERLRLQALLEEMALGQTGVVDPATAPRTGKLLGAENIVTGSLSGDIQAVTALASASRARVIGNAAVTVNQDNFFQLPGAIAADVAEIKGISLTPSEKKAIGAIHTRSMDAVLYYGKALNALDQEDWKTALNYFNKAIAADPGFELAILGREACPDDSSEGMSSPEKMAPQQMKAQIESNVNDAVEDQNEADEAAKDSLSGGGSGGGH
ncbi:MAG: tetratricopeptide repeat protein [Thermodesulfobacteriota bacterium]|nr:tetratricopeptide repeat protein [Thermodesulfobacteriota bacterium]